MGPPGPEKSTYPMQETKSGRPRSEECHNAILQTAIDLVLELGFRAVSIESIAAKTGVAKTTIYRRWPNKAAIVMDAFMLRFASGTQFQTAKPTAKRVTDSIRLQMRTLARAFRSKDG